MLDFIAVWLKRTLLVAIIGSTGVALAGGVVQLAPAAHSKKAQPGSTAPAVAQKSAAAKPSKEDKTAVAAANKSLSAPSTKTPVGKQKSVTAQKKRKVIWAHRWHASHRAQVFKKPIAKGSPAVHRVGRHAGSLPKGAIVVSTEDLNRFVFPAPVTKGPIFPADAPVLGAPTYLDGNTQILVQFAPGSDAPFDMVVELMGGQVKNYVLVPKNIPGVVYFARNVVAPARTWKRASRTSSSESQRSADIALLKQVVMGQIPDEFFPVHLPKGTKLSKFDIIPKESWSDGSGRKILIYLLKSVDGQAAVVSAPEFYVKGMSALLLDGDVVDATHSPLLYVIEGRDRG